MSRDLSGTIRSMFRGTNFNQCWSSRRSRFNSSLPVKYMEIPINEDTFLMPILALDTFFAIVEEGGDDRIDSIVVSLNTIGKVPRYKSLDRYMRDVLLETYKDSRLVELKVKDCEDTEIPYYATNGAIFDKDLKPLMICSYLIERFQENTVNAGEPDTPVTKYRVVKPVVWVDYTPVMAKSNPMEKFIANKMISTCLDGLYSLARNHSYRIVDIGDKKARIEIDSCPFNIITTDIPSISTTNQKLLQIAKDHIEELTQ